jgi:hypothetical protein
MALSESEKEASEASGEEVSEQVKSSHGGDRTGIITPFESSQFWANFPVVFNSRSSATESWQR